jgi:hypothetical protein
VDDVVIGAIQIEEDVAGIAITGKGVKEDVESFAIAQPQEGHRGSTGELKGGPNPVTGKRLAAGAVNQANLVIVARHGPQYSRPCWRIRPVPGTSEKSGSTTAPEFPTSNNAVHRIVQGSLSTVNKIEQHTAIDLSHRP